MSLFIEVTAVIDMTTSMNMLVSLDKIIDIRPRDNGCAIRFSDGKLLYVRDSYEKFAEQYSIRKVSSEDIKKRFPTKPQTKSEEPSQT